MLMKTPRGTQPADASSFDVLMASLRIPERPAAVRAARDVAVKAKSERIAAQTRHVEAGALLRTQRLGKAPMITHQQVDDLGAAIAPILESEEAANSEHQRLVAEFSADVREQLDLPLRRYHEAVAAKMTELENLLAIGVHLHSDSVSAGVRLPSKLPSISATLIAHVHAMRRVLAVAK